MSEGEKLIPINIEEAMKSAYIDYSMSVIVSRALPDVRDGLKPVHRRVLYGMHQLGLRGSSKFKKSAFIVGEVLGKYHPHGDSSVYDTMVRMAQEWSLRYLLVDGQGNYGSVDGDSPAAMRYTEARMQKISEEMVADLDKDTVDHQLNYDDSIMEPTVLPTKIPSLLVNGASGIAVGMATNMPPHNLTEVIDGTVAYIENNDISIDELIQFVKAPDFPTGGIIYGYDGVKQAFETGRGRIVMRAKAEIEEVNGRECIIVTEIPYQVNKAEMIRKTAEMINDKKIDGTNNVYVKQQNKMHSNVHSNVVTICQYEPHPSQSIIVQAGATEISNITAKLQSFNNDLVQNAGNLNNNVYNLKLEGIEYYNGSNINSLLYGKHYLHTTNSIDHQVRQGDALIERRMVHSRFNNAAY